MKKEEENSQNGTENHPLYINTYYVYILATKCKRKKRWNPKISYENRKQERTNEKSNTLCKVH